MGWWRSVARAEPGSVAGSWSTWTDQDAVEAEYRLATLLLLAADPAAAGATASAIARDTARFRPARL